MRLRVFTPDIVEVTYGPSATLPPTDPLAVVASPSGTPWTAAETSKDITLRTSALVVTVARSTGSVRFADLSGRVYLAEADDGGKSLTPAVVGGQPTLRSRQGFVLQPGEAVYGLGQHPGSPLDYRGTKVHLQQENRDVAVPVLLSSRGYGVFWDNPAVTDVDAGATIPGGLTWTSEAADAIDYYFIGGPALRDVVARYRWLTGPAPMLAEWTWGFWQCREHYETQQELLGVVAEYRRLHLPLDGIIQDWQYWRPGGWGSDEFDPTRYPDPAAMVRTVHDEHAHIIISIWPRFDLGLANLAALEKAGAVYPKVYPNVYPKGEGKWYDPFNPEGRRLYWKFLSQHLFSIGIDGWWMDASEPELGGHWGELRDVTTAAGSGARVFNAYPLEHTTGVYQGQRAESSAKRVFILTRSAWAGQQRNAAVTWSGDTTGTWAVFRQQIPAGLDFVMSGIPYWNTDIGGFFGGNPQDPAYAELFTRWFQFGAFCPMFRVHGTGGPKEVWRFPKATQAVLADFIRLRYHLLPYIYSDAWSVTHDNASMLRPLVMDFQNDARVLNIPDQFLFGPSIMVCPVTEPGAKARSVYFPAGTHWCDFWTGAVVSGGHTLTVPVNIRTLPLFVRAGSIIPYGPSEEYARQKTDPIELRVYRGADGHFTLYEDSGDGYAYEHGAYATIPITWDEHRQTLTIGRREGSFPGMPQTHRFHIVWVSPGHGVGLAPSANPDAKVTYTGKPLTLSPES